MDSGNNTSYFDLDYSRQIYLISVYSEIVVEFENQIAYERIILSRLDEGYTKEGAEELCQYIRDNLPVVKELIKKMKQNTQEIRGLYELSQLHKKNKQASQFSLPHNEAKNSLHDYQHILLHNGGHALLHHLVFAFCGVH